MNTEVAVLRDFIKRIQDALGTEETGEALIEVARNAHRCELELASYHNVDLCDHDGTPISECKGASCKSHKRCCWQ